MTESSSITKKKILESAKKEFLENGFMNASLRTIASNAGLTTGAMYRHFENKDELFCSLVDDAIDYTTAIVKTADKYSHEQSNPLSEEHFHFEEKIIEEFLDYIYDNFDAFTLLLTKAHGSKHENFLEEISLLYTKCCQTTFIWMYEEGYAPKKVKGMTVHVIASTLINAFAEIVLHKMSRDEATEYVENITEFSRFGTLHMLGVSHH